MLRYSVIGVRCINTYEVMRNIITICLGVLLVLPCFLVLNESDNVALNVAGLLYSFALTLALKYAKEFKVFRIKMKNLLKFMDHEE
jgi:hypothetical protein